MRLELKYFGMLVEVTLCNAESISTPQKELTVTDLKKLLINKYPKLETYTFNIAVNQKIASPEDLLSEGNEVAFLPPFAGG